MNRLQKKCFIASAGFHLLLFVVLLVGPAFFSRSTIDNSPVLTFVDLSKVTDGPTTGARNPNVAPPQVREIVQPPQPQPPIPQPIIKPKDTPPPQHDIEREVKPIEKDPLATKPKKKMEVSTTPITRPKPKPANTSSKDDSAAQAREQAAKIAAQFRNAVSGLKNNLSPSTAFELPGNGGQASINWAQGVVSIYYDAWIPPDELGANEDVNTKVSVTIAADGSVISARIVKPSRSAVADNSVQRALNRVKSTVPFPPGAKDKERTINIIFNPIVKRQAG